LAEVKCFSEWKAGRIETLDEVPDAVYVQVQHGLAVTGYAWGVIIILAGGQRLVWFEVDRHEEFIAALINAERVFWDAVVAGQPPEADAHGATTDALRRLFPKDSGKKIVLDHPSVLKLAQDLTDWKAKAKAADEEWEARKNAMKLLMGDAAELEIPGYGCLTWKTSKVSKKPVFDEERFRKEQPELYAKYVKTIPTGGTRTFYDKPKKAEEDAA
jgi:predicted phage-related endonuclease